MARWKQDEVDVACEAWAFQWCALFARDPRKASEHLGRVGSTLSLVKMMGDGASSSTVVEQGFPEVFLGVGLVVSCIIKHLNESDREMLFRHYIDRWYAQRPVPGLERSIEVVKLRYPIKQTIIAQRMGVSVATYHQRRDRAKACVATALGVSRDHSRAESDCELTS
jgi:hypothetical protein